MVKLIAIDRSASCKLWGSCVVKPSYSFSIQGTSINSAFELGQQASIVHFTAFCIVIISLT